MRAIVVERQGIDDAAAREGDARLALEEGNLFRPAEAQRMSLVEAAGDQARHVARCDRTERDAALRRRDLDHRLEPEQAARTGAHDLDRNALPARLVDDCRRDLVGPDGAGRRIAGDEDLHCPTSREISSTQSGVSRAIGSPSSIADGAQAHRPKTIGGFDA